MSQNSFDSRATLSVGGRDLTIHRLDALQSRFDVARLPFSLKILLENLLRTEGNGAVTAADIEALAGWDAKATPSQEIAFTPARVVMQDFTGVPAVVDLAAMRDAMAALGGDPAKIEPLVPAELVIDHSVQVDAYGTADAFAINAEREFERNRERYQFLKWGQQAFETFKVVPPDTGIVHQVNLEYLSRVVFVDERTGMAYPDTLVGTDSHTTMINGLGVLGWGVGGIEAEALLLGQPLYQLMPVVVGCRLTGQLRPGPTATDLVLTLPLFIGYHIGVVFLPIRNAADVVTAELVTLAESSMLAYIGLTLGIGIGFVAVAARLDRGARRTDATERAPARERLAGDLGEKGERHAARIGRVLAIQVVDRPLDPFNNLLPLFVFGLRPIVRRHG